MWSHFWTEPRPARLHLFAADIVPVDRTTRERAASGSQNGAQRLAAARRDDVAEHAASQSADDQARRAIGLFAIIIASRDRKSTRLNSSHSCAPRIPSSA